jgi:hypothetical protein
MNVQQYRITLAAFGLVAFLALLALAGWLARVGHPVPAAWTGTGAIAAGTLGLFELLHELGRS